MFAGLLEPVLSGSVTFESSILAPLHSNYLYEESKESFTYNSAQLIKNAALQKRVSRHMNFAFCSVIFGVHPDIFFCFCVKCLTVFCLSC